MKKSSSQNPLVSIVIPTYNHRDYILDTLDSVFAQTFADYEIIVINDGSPDDTGELLRPLVDAGKIRYFEQANAGQASARNRGLDEARGEFVAFLDDDDLWPPDKLEWQVEFLRQNSNAMAVAGEAATFSTDGSGDGNDFLSRRKPLFEKGFLDFKSLFSGPPMISPGQVLIRTDVLHRVDGLNANMKGTDDWDLWFRIARVGTIATVPRGALLYRLHEFNASKNLWSMLDNALAVIRAQAPTLPRSSRGECLRRANRFVYAVFGQPLLLQARGQLKSRDWSALRSLFKVLRIFVPLSLNDPRLLKQLLGNTLSLNSFGQKIKSRIMKHSGAPKQQGN